MKLFQFLKKSTFTIWGVTSTFTKVGRLKDFISKLEISCVFYVELVELIIVHFIFMYEAIAIIEEINFYYLTWSHQLFPKGGSTQKCYSLIWNFLCPLCRARRADHFAPYIEYVALSIIEKINFYYWRITSNFCRGVDRKFFKLVFFPLCIARQPNHSAPHTHVWSDFYLWQN